MLPSPYSLYQHIAGKGYVPPMAAQITVESLTQTKEDVAGRLERKYVGTGEHLKVIMEADRVSVFKCFYGTEPETESTWLAGDEPGHGMKLPLWAERLMQAEVMVMQEKIETTVDYLLHQLEK